MQHERDTGMHLHRFTMLGDVSQESNVSDSRSSVQILNVSRGFQVGEVIGVGFGGFRV